MTAANSAVFKRLTSFAVAREVAIADADAPRWVHANPIADGILAELIIHEYIGFGRHRFLAWMELPAKSSERANQLDGRLAESSNPEASNQPVMDLNNSERAEDPSRTFFIGLLGFDHDPDEPQFPVLKDIQGFDVALISELPVQPIATGAVIKDVVEAGMKGDPGYSGHDNYEVMRLFPSIKVFESLAPLDDSVIWATFFRLCVDECVFGSSWIEVELANSLSALAELDVPSLPYRELCRSVFDMDPRGLYMSLYRCIEATYAYEKASKLGASLSSGLSWYEVAAALDTEMGWHPPESQSLQVALEHAQESELRQLCDCLGVEVGKDIRVSAGRGIYKLRNQIVHYRPTNDRLMVDEMDWNRVCNLLVTISLDVFWAAYSNA